MLADAARCVKCGLCLAECPTYALSASEALSPRGRIALIQALDAGQLPADGHGAEILGSCLLCRRCEAVCPSAVPFARLMDQGRAQLRGRLSRRERWLPALLSRPTLSRRLLWLGRLLPKSSSLGRVARQASAVATSLKPLYRPKEGEVRGRVGLFTGCTGELLDAPALEAALALLLAAGYEVAVPEGQGCCGALDAHAGNAARAGALMERNRAAFAGAGRLDAILSIATGCGAWLGDQQNPPAPHEDICAFLAREEVLARLRFHPLRAVVAVHLPCSLVNVLKTEQAVLHLLEKVPDLQVREIGRRGGCCGAAGTAAILRPGMARELRQPLLDELDDLGPDLVVSSNPSCRLHLADGDDSGANHLHPLVLLAQQLVRE
ncbi:(Fe-S)-binding protein [Thiolapillus sp.]